jgi:hypothetical protein
MVVAHRRNRPHAWSSDAALVGGALQESTVPRHPRATKTHTEGNTMGILSDIFHKIFPANHPAVAAAGGTTATNAPPAGGSGTVNTTPGPSSIQADEVMPTVDVEAILRDKASKTPEKLNWQTSIVDLMKLLGLDSSLANRKQLAQELGYTGDTNDSATMNIWLQKQVMQKLAQNGGKVPAGLQ